MSARNLDTENFSGLDSRGKSKLLSPKNELLVKFMKLRHGFPQEDLAIRIGIDQTTASIIFSCWLETLDACFEEIPIRLSTACINRFSPTFFWMNTVIHV